MEQLVLYINIHFGLVLLLIFLAFFGFLVLALYIIKLDNAREKQLIIDLNCGHQIWCTAGAEGGTYCSCKTVPFMLNNIEERYETIARIATTTARGSE